MAAGLFQRGQLAEAREIAALAAGNPFAEDRIAREQALLAEAWVESAGASPEQWAVPQPNPNVQALAEKAEALLSDARLRYLKLRARLPRQTASIYQDLVFFVLFNRVSPELEKLIERCEQAPVETLRVNGYTSFLKDAAHFLPDGLLDAYRDVGYERLYAVFFQIRRAYQYIATGFAGSSPAARQVRARIWQSVFTRDMHRYQRALAMRMGDIITLITGPSGSGKEQVAQALGWSRYIPFDAKRQCFEANFRGLFFPINLSALSPTLIESELFGHRKGAFTGALQDREGYLETCGPFGTVFLDEIGEVEASIQVKLLRVLQTRSFARIGDTVSRPFEGKLMAATNRDLEAEMQAGGFRQDFYFRLCADRIETPSLRAIIDQTPGELERIVSYIAHNFAGPEEAGSLTGEVMGTIQTQLGADYPWPGNFRELEQCIRNVLVHGEYQPVLLQGKDGSDSTSGIFKGLLQNGLPPAEAILRRYVRHVVSQSETYEKASSILEMDRRTIKRHLQD
ncbi:MAG: sigma-54-dependent transcriptional regulator [Opitutales bacterium]